MRSVRQRGDVIGNLSSDTPPSDRIDASDPGRSRGQAIILVLLAAAIFYVVTGYEVLH